MIVAPAGAAPAAAAIDHFYAWGPAPQDHPCQETPARILCPCCQGSGEHCHGRGPELEDYPCAACQGEGELAVALLPLTRAGPESRFAPIALAPAETPVLRRTAA